MGIGLLFENVFVVKKATLWGIGLLFENVFVVATGTLFGNRAAF